MSTVELALDGLGWHPAAWRIAGDDAGRASDPRRWTAVVRAADEAGVDAVHLEDAFAAPGGGHPDRVADRVDSVLLASLLGPLTRRVGLVPTITTTHTEPFHHAKAIATLDHISKGRAGVRVRVSPFASDAALVGRREVTDPVLVAGTDPGDQVRELFDEAADYVEVLRRLWDSWEDDAEIRDVATGRFVDRDKLHYVDFAGRWFSVRGPLITPRPPQGQPVVSVLAHAPSIYRFAARTADVVHVTPFDRADLARIVAEVRAAEAATGRTGEPLRIVPDVVVTVDASAAVAAGRAARLDELAGGPVETDTLAFAGSADELVDLTRDWYAEGIDGIRYRPQSVTHDVAALTSTVLPALRPGGPPASASLRARYGLDRPHSRYALQEAR